MLMFNVRVMRQWKGVSGYKTKLNDFLRNAGCKMKFNCILLVSLFMATLSGCEKADNELTLLKEKAESGDVIAQYNLGFAYAEGDGTPVDLVQALKWFRRAANSGDVDAQYNLAVMYDDGDGVDEDNEEAVKWDTAAAIQGDQISQYNLAVMYDECTGVGQDYSKALHWYRQAAEQGDRDTQYSIGMLYETGDVGESDRVEAYAWYTLAAKNGELNAKEKCVQLEAGFTEEQLKSGKSRCSEIMFLYGID